MTVPISTIVSVSVTRSTRTVTQAGFGVAMIFGTTGSFASGLVRTYNNMTDVAVDFTSGNDEYKAANALFSQTPAPEEVKITQRLAAVSQIQTIVFDADIILANSIACSIDGTALAATPFNATNAQTLTDFAALIQATDGVTTAVSDGVHTITVTAAVAGVPVTISGVLVTGGLTQAAAVTTATTPNVGMAEDITAIRLVDDDWYGCLCMDRTAVVVGVTAKSIEAMPKLFISCSDAVDIYDATKTTDIAYILSAANYDRTSIIFNETPADFPDAAWFGRMLPTDPGSATWMFKTLSGITGSNSLSTTEINAILAKNANLMVEAGGIDITEEATVASGEYLDIMRGIDWLTARMQENIYQELVTSDKIAYTDAGIAIIENLVRKTILNGISVGLLTPDPDTFDGEPFLVGVPLVKDVSTTDKGTRTLNNVTWQATLQGAIHKVVISGRVEL